MVTNAKKREQKERKHAFKSVPYRFVPAPLSKYIARRAVRAVSQSSLLRNLHSTIAVLQQHDDKWFIVEWRGETLMW